MSRGTGDLSLHDALRRLLERRPIVIGVDFDGTLAPLADHPDLAKPDVRALSLLRGLAAKPGLRVVLVTGRALADLKGRLGAPLPGVALIGEHGNDMGAPPMIDDRVMTEAATLVRELVSSLEGAVYEVKPRSVTFHYRMVREAERKPALERLRNWAHGHPEVKVLEGKQVIELTTAAREKGDAIAELASDAVGVIYVGDDVTDESVFQRLGPNDVGIKVGGGETAAAFRVPDVAAVVELLEVIDLISG